MGFEMGRFVLRSFHHTKWDVSTVVHGDDFLSEGPAVGLKRMNDAFEKEFQVKTEVVGLDPG